MGRPRNVFILLMAVAAALLLNACVAVRTTPHPGAYMGVRGTYHNWYYYPDSRVYYEITEHYYYYPYGGTWRRAKRLPHGWVLHDRDRVRMRIAGPPYLRHAEHRRRYPARSARGGMGSPQPYVQRDFSNREYRNRRRDEESNRAHGPEQGRRGVAGAEFSARQSREADRKMPPGHARSEEVLRRTQYPKPRRDAQRSLQNSRHYEHARPRAYGSPVDDKVRSRRERPSQHRPETRHGATHKRVSPPGSPAQVNSDRRGRDRLDRRQVRRVGEGAARPTPSVAAERHQTREGDVRKGRAEKDRRNESGGRQGQEAVSGPDQGASR